MRAVSGSTGGGGGEGGGVGQCLPLFLQLNVVVRKRERGEIHGWTPERVVTRKKRKMMNVYDTNSVIVEKLSIHTDQTTCLFYK